MVQSIKIISQRNTETHGKNHQNWDSAIQSIPGLLQSCLNLSSTSHKWLVNTLLVVNLNTPGLRR
jgi:hypothetical protein